jgi:hypothetical protein
MATLTTSDLEHAQIDWRLASYADLLRRRAIGIGGPLLQRVSGCPEQARLPKRSLPRW